MPEESLSYVAEGFVPGLLMFLLSTLGLLPTHRLFLLSSKRPPSFQICLVDFFVLTALVAATTSFLWNLLPDPTKAHGVGWVVIYCFLVVVWWFVVAISLSRLNIATPLARVVYLGLAVPGAFLTPPYSVMELLVHHPVADSPSLLSADYLPAACCILAYFACIPLSWWVVGKSEKNSGPPDARP